MLIEMIEFFVLLSNSNNNMNNMKNMSIINNKDQN